ncbi:MAG: dephospho-CoA kinase [Planctomycetota bacterium]|jgi:dephospho-CoA kinase
MPNPSPSHPLVLGVLGGVAAGKSTVAAFLAGEKGRILSADAIAREVLESTEGCAALVERYGPGALDEQGIPDRVALAARIFGEPVERTWLESWTHPRVRARILADLDQARRAGVPRVVLDVPLLMENDPQHHLMAECDHLVFVEVSDAERDRRAVASRGWEPGEVARREAAQLPLDTKRSRADFVIAGEVSLTELAHAIDAILRELGH